MEPQEMNKCKLEPRNKNYAPFYKAPHWLIGEHSETLFKERRDVQTQECENARSLLPGKDMDLCCRKKGF